MLKPQSGGDGVTDTDREYIWTATTKELREELAYARKSPNRDEVYELAIATEILGRGKPSKPIFSGTVA